MISGYLFAILTGIFFGLQGTLGKVLTQKVPPFVVTWIIFTFALPYVLALLIAEGIPTILWSNFLWATAVSFAINIFAWYFFFTALHKSTLANTMPFTAFTPLFLIPVGYFMLGELPDIKGILGLFLIIAGGYGIHLKSGQWLAPFKSLLRDRGTRLMLIVALMWSVSATAEKIAVVSSSQAFYATVIDSLLALAYLPIIFKSRRSNFSAISENFGGLLLIGLVSGLMILFQFTALKTLFVSYVIAFKRAGVIISVLFGIFLFKEKNALKNVFFTGMMVGGVFLILL